MKILTCLKLELGRNEFFASPDTDIDFLYRVGAAFGIPNSLTYPAGMDNIGSGLCFLAWEKSPDFAFGTRGTFYIRPLRQSSTMYVPLYGQPPYFSKARDEAGCNEYKKKTTWQISSSSLSSISFHWVHGVCQTNLMCRKKDIIRGVNKTKVKNSATNLTLLKALLPLAGKKSQHLKVRLVTEICLVNLCWWESLNEQEKCLFIPITNLIGLCFDTAMTNCVLRHYDNCGVTLRLKMSPSGNLCTCWYHCFFSLSCTYMLCLWKWNTQPLGNKAWIHAQISVNFWSKWWQKWRLRII